MERLGKTERAIAQIRAAAIEPNTLVGIDAVQILTNRAKSTIYGLISQGDFPRQAKPGRWRAADLRQWLGGQMGA